MIRDAQTTSSVSSKIFISASSFLRRATRALQQGLRHGTWWDPRLPAIVAVVVVALCGLPAVWNSHWMWIDDQMVVGGQLWPPDNIFNQLWHAQGREFIVHGLYFKLLSLAFPLRPFWYYLTNYATHVCVIGLAAWLVWRATASGTATTLCALTVGFASTGPEVFLTLLKQELQMTLWLLVALLAVQRLLQLDRLWLAGTLVVLAVATFLSGTLGKENFVILPIGLAGGFLCASLTAPLRRLPWRVLAGVLVASLGTIAVFVERYLLGVRGVAEGTYTGSLFIFHPTLNSSLQRTRFFYAFQTGDIIALVAVATVACAGCVIAARFRNRNLSAAQIVAVTCAAAALTQIVFNVVFFSFAHIYYLYPAGILGPIALACLWPTGPGRLPLAAALVGTTILTLPTFAVRLYAQNVIPALEWRLITAIAGTPPRSLVLLGFPPDAEMIGNTDVLLRHVLHRSDITIASAFDTNNAARVSEAYAAHRPVFLAFVYEPGENWKVGVRGLAQKSRAEILAQASAHRISQICPYLQETLGPWLITVSRIVPSLPPVMTIRFGYAWELDRLPPPSAAMFGCTSS